MSNTYTPSRWVIIQIDDGRTYIGVRKILAGWYGNYTDPDTWRLSSVITGTHDRVDHFEIENESGSVYKCYKQNEGFSAYTASVYESFKKAFEGKGTIKTISSEEL